MMLTDLQMAYFHEKAMESKKDTKLMKWSPSLVGTIKLNINGSSFGNPGHAGVGGIFRDANEVWCILGQLSLWWKRFG